MSKFLITGASGFVGSHLVDLGLRLGHEIHAGIRKSSSKKYLQDPKIQFFEVDFEKMDEMAERLAEEKFDYIIHNAGRTKAADKSEYFTVNTEYTIAFAKCLIEKKCVPKKFVFISSFAATGPADAAGVDILDRNTPPHPVTQYGESKLAAERGLALLTEIPINIIRPTAVFGPRDTEMFTLFKMINNNLELYMGRLEQRLSFIYVKDLADCIFKSCLTSHSNKIYQVTDGGVYDSSDFYRFTKEALNKRTLTFHIPIGVLKIVAKVLENVFSSRKKLPPLNPEKLHEITATNWTCDISPLKDELSFKPTYTLQEAILETVAWYKAKKWL